MESTSSSERVTFWDLKARLIKAVNARILNGEFSERGLARILGISQPQIHNVLKGARKLQGELADRLLTLLGLSLADLFRPEELAPRGEQAGRSASGPERWLFGVDQAPPRKPPSPETRATKRHEVIGN